MSYLHNNEEPIILLDDPISPGAEDWFYFACDLWLEAGESVSTHLGSVVLGTIIVNSTFIGAATFNGKTYSQVYGIKVRADDAEGGQLEVTFNVSTTRPGVVDLGRTNIKFTAIIDIKKL